MRSLCSYHGTVAKRLWGPILTLGTISLLVISGYAISRKRFSTASKEDLAKVVDPDLLLPIPNDSEHLARFARLQSLFETPWVESDADTPPEVRRTNFSQLETHLGKIEALLAEGPVQRPMRHSNKRNDSLIFQKGFFRALQTAIGAETKAGNHVRAIRLLRLGSRVLQALRSSARTQSEYLVDGTCTAILHQAVTGTVPRLDERELADLALMFTEAPPTDECLRNALHGEFQVHVWNILPNPLKGLSDAGCGPDLLEEALEIDSVGNYDPVETTRILSNQYSEIRARALLPRSATSSAFGAWGSYRKVQALVDSLPRPAADKTGLQGRIDSVVHAWKMERTPNSFGIWLVNNLRPLMSDSLMSLSYRLRTSQEGIRTLIALRRYQIKNGRLPTSLKALIDEGFLASMPLDYLSFAKGHRPGALVPLRYAPRRKLLWSAGLDGKDDGGPSSIKPYEPDFVWIIR